MVRSSVEKRDHEKALRVISMTRPDLTTAITAAKRMASEHFDVELDESAIAAVIEDVWWGSRDIYACFHGGIVTKSEAASIVIAHVDTRLIRNKGDMEAIIDWDRVAKDFQAALESILE